MNGPDPNLGLLGAVVSGPGIQDGTTIVSLDVTNNTIKLSQPATQDVSGGTYSFRGPNQKLLTNGIANGLGPFPRSSRSGTANRRSGRGRRRPSLRVVFDRRQREGRDYRPSARVLETVAR